MAQLTLKMDAPVTATGLGKAAVTGVRGGVEGIAGAAGDIGKGQRWLVRKVAGMLGADEQLQETLGKWAGYTNPVLGYGPSSEDVGAITDAGVQALPESVSGPIQDVTRHEAENPAERIAETAGTFAGGAVLPVGEVGALTNLGIRAGRIAVPTAAVEGVGAMADQAGLSPETKQAMQIIAGIVAGGSVGVAEHGFRTRSAARIVASNPKAVEVVSQALKDAGMAPEEMAAKLKDLGVEAVPADVATTLRQETQRIQATGGEGRGIIEPKLTERDIGKGDRLSVDAEAAVGPEVQRSDALQALHDRKEAIGPEYEAAHKAQQGDVPTQDILDAIDSDLGVVKSPEVEAALKRVRKSLHLRDTDVLDPSSEGLHEARQAIDNELYGKKGPRDIGGKTAAVLQKYRDMIDKALETVGPIKEADVKYSQVGKEERAFDTGQEIYENPRGGPSPTEFQRNWDKFSEGERARLVEGVNVETWRKLGMNSNDLVELKKLLKGTGKSNTEKLVTAIGQDKVDALWKAIEREGTFSNTYKKVVEGSKTAESQAQPTSERFAPDAADLVTTMTAGPKAGLAQFGIRSLRRMAQKMLAANPNKNNAAIAKLLMSDKPDDLMRAITELRKVGPTIIPEAAIPALEQRKKERQPTDIGTITRPGGG